MLYKNQLRDAVVAAIQAAGTQAGASIWNNRDMPLMPASLPAVIVSAPSERKDSEGRGPVLFTTVATIQIDARVQGTDLSTVVSNLDLLQEQIYDAVLANPSITSMVQQFVSVDAQQDFSSDTRSHIGDLQITIGMEFPELYNPVMPNQLNDIHLTGAATIPGGGTTPPFQADYPQT